MPLRILHLHLTDSEKSWGGADLAVWNILWGMKEIFGEAVMGGVNRSLLADRLESVSIPRFKIEKSKFRTFQTLKKIDQALRNFEPHLIHSHHRYLAFLCDFFFKRRCFILHTEHVLHRNRRRLFRYGHFVTAVSEGVRENLMRYYRVPANRVMTIPYGVSPRPVSPDQLQQFQRNYPREKGDVFALCLARLAEQKGHRYLIEAVCQLPEPFRRRLKIFLAGEGPLDSFLRKKVTQHQLERQFVFLGFSPWTSELLALCDFLILPSLYEGMPLAILEAYAAGKAVIATDIPGTREVILENQTGSLVPPRDPEALARVIQKWMDQQEGIVRWGARAKEESLRRFSFETMINSYHELYEKIACKKNSF